MPARPPTRINRHLPTHECLRAHGPKCYNVGLMPFSWTFSPICIEQRRRTRSNVTPYRPRGYHDARQRSEPGRARQLPRRAVASSLRLALLRPALLFCLVLSMYVAVFLFSFVYCSCTCLLVMFCLALLRPTPGRPARPVAEMVASLVFQPGSNKPRTSLRALLSCMGRLFQPPYSNPRLYIYIYPSIYIHMYI